MDHIPEGFVKEDFRIDGSRHIVLTTASMMSLLGRACTWYVDATFKLVKRPFYQLFSVHAFIKSGDSMKQVPLCFVLMSSKRTVDYIGVFTRIIAHLPQPLAVKRVVADYEAATWQALFYQRYTAEDACSTIHRPSFERSRSLVCKLLMDRMWGQTHFVET